MKYIVFCGLNVYFFHSKENHKVILVQYPHNVQNLIALNTEKCDAIETECVKKQKRGENLMRK